MSLPLARRRKSAPCARRTPGLRVEPLEGRDLPSAGTWPGFLHPLSETEPNDTLDLAQSVGDLSANQRAEVVGLIGGEPGRSGDVDWYSFFLDQAARVRLTAPPGASGAAPPVVLSLYNTDPDRADPLVPLGHRLLAQDEGSPAGGAAAIDRVLGPGTYFVAVSGAGNRYFHPFLAGSGLAGSTGAYGLLVTSSPLDLPPDDGPTVLTVEPGTDSFLDRSPLTVRVSFSEDLDESTIVDGDTVQLVFSPDGSFGEGDPPVPLASVSYSAGLRELRLTPAAPLAPGLYEVLLSGQSAPGRDVLAGPDGVPLGSTALHPEGEDFQAVFQIVGSEGRPVADSTPGDDTPATATDLGNLTSLGPVQVAGVVGDDPFYDPASDDPLVSNPAADVDLYHFRVAGPGRFALIAEAFAGRIGSALDPALTLFQRVDGGALRLVGTNNNTLNDSVASNDTVPLFTDAALFAGLTEGDYYLAVSSAGNDPGSGPDGVFIPDEPHSGQNGGSRGEYVLTLLVHADDEAPQVTGVTPGDGAVLGGPPTNLVVRFSEPVNLQRLAYEAFQQTSQSTVESVFVQGPDGTRYLPRLESYDPSTGEARFLMLDALANGTYELHLSGAEGLTDLAGNPLVGNGVDGADHIVRFAVEGPARGSDGNPLRWLTQEPNDDAGHAQDLGILFPHELQAGVIVVRDFTAAPGEPPADGADYYRFEVLQFQSYFFNLTGSGLPAGAALTILDADGKVVDAVPQGSEGDLQAFLNPGKYVVRVGDWTPQQAPGVAYQLELKLGGLPENPTPLTTGAAPAVGIRLVQNGPPAGQPPPTPVVELPPALSSNVILSGPPPVSPRFPGVPTQADVTVSSGVALALVSLTPPGGGDFRGGATGPAQGPPGLLRDLRAGPLGGGPGAARDTNDTPFVRLPGPGGPDGPPGGNEGVSPLFEVRALEHLDRFLTRWWTDLLDLAFQGTDWLGTPQASPPLPEPPEVGPGDETDTGEGEGQECPCAARPPAALGGPLGLLIVLGVVVANNRAGPAPKRRAQLPPNRTAGGKGA